jgi:hypothetical protein
MDPAEALGSWEPTAGGRTLSIRLEGELDAGGRIRLHGVTDRAQVPNSLEPDWIEVSPPSWPVSREELVFLWETDDRQNLVPDPATGKERAYPLRAAGRAFLDHHRAMRTDGGRWVAPTEAGQRLAAAVERTGAVSLELTLTPRELPEGEARVVAAFARGSSPQLLLGQRGRDLILRISTSEQRDAPPIRLARLAAGQARHVVVSYSPASLRVWIDGETVEPEAGPRGHLNRWRPAALSFGALPNGSAPWRGTIEGVAIWARALEEAEAREEHLRYQRVRSGRLEVESRTVRARLRARSKIPTLAEITPYRVALAIFEYEVASGADRGETLRVAHWVVLDGEPQPIAQSAAGREMELTLEPFAANPQLEPHFLSDTLDGTGSGGLWYAVAAEPR